MLVHIFSDIIVLCFHGVYCVALVFWCDGVPMRSGVLVLVCVVACFPYLVVCPPRTWNQWVQTLPSQSAGEAGPGERERSSGKSAGHWGGNLYLWVGSLYLAVLWGVGTGHGLADVVPHAIAQVDIGVMEGAEVDSQGEGQKVLYGLLNFQVGCGLGVGVVGRKVRGGQASDCI